MPGKMEGRRRRGKQDEMVGWHHDSMDRSLSKLQEQGRRQEGALQSMRTQRIRHDLVTEQQKQTYFLKLQNFHIKSILETMLCVSYISMYVS